MPSCTVIPTSTAKTTTYEMKHHERVLGRYGYTLLRCIGSGTYGRVHEAFAERWKCNVAVKIISKKNSPQEYVRKFLPRELQAMKTLKHKNIISLYQVIETTSYMYIVEELASGGDVAEWMSDHGACNEQQARKWFRQLCEGVAYMHSNGIAHRDLKLDNLLIDSDGNIKIADFGFARPVENQNLSRTFCGTRSYMPPEVLLRESYNPFLFDMWSLGTILYILVTDQFPFEDDNMGVFVRKLQKGVHFPAQKRIPQDCKVLIGKLLTDASKRITSEVVLEQPWIRKLNQDRQTVDSTPKKESLPVPMQPKQRPPLRHFVKLPEACFYKKPRPPLRPINGFPKYIR
ncbi:testis-specific serine/threonine-protein kinase 4-like [Protopterus annectens]|uniref:testis-specific serine/threonine-protein kinase 4-like n=1 Tax=Protopterus annectens TaxID=7888 RepID=UPI001CFA9B41|nr:testis-specific serine/threonine-protein kinase 4-like [Protopterus annectens]